MIGEMLLEHVQKKSIYTLTTYNNEKQTYHEIDPKILKINDFFSKHSFKKTTQCTYTKIIGA